MMEGRAILHIWMGNEFHMSYHNRGGNWEQKNQGEQPPGSPWDIQLLNNIIRNRKVDELTYMALASGPHESNVTLLPYFLLESKKKNRTRQFSYVRTQS
jgi:hypothetical protein